MWLFYLLLSRVKYRNSVTMWHLYRWDNSSISWKEKWQRRHCVIFKPRVLKACNEVLGLCGSVGKTGNMRCWRGLGGGNACCRAVTNEGGFSQPWFGSFTGQRDGSAQGSSSLLPLSVFTWEGVELHAARTPYLQSQKRGCWARGNQHLILYWVYACLKGWQGWMTLGIHLNCVSVGFSLYCRYSCR